MVMARQDRAAHVDERDDERDEEIHWLDAEHASSGSPVVVHETTVRPARAGVVGWGRHTTTPPGDGSGARVLREE